MLQERFDDALGVYAATTQGERHLLVLLASTPEGFAHHHSEPSLTKGQVQAALVEGRHLRERALRIRENTARR